MIRRLYIYILAMLAVALSSCVREELVEQLPEDKPTSTVTGRVTVGISAILPESTVTKAVIDPKTDIHSLHLILFDERGMLVEVCEAETLGDSEHGDHHDGKNYKVTLTLTEEKRYIHFIANCPAPDRITYGHEAQIIGNMYVKDHATAYWARIEVPYILVEEDTDNDGLYELVETIHPLFEHVPLLRNYAEITISDETEDVDRANPPTDRDAFIFTGYTVYNTIDRGTVAPYNTSTQQFQSFIGSNGTAYTYPQLLSLGYEGHTLASSVFQTDIPKDENEQVIVYAPDEPFYLYERKVSVKTNEEDKWLESPPHIIIKGDYKPANSTVWSTYYYKVDLVYNIMSDPNNTPDNPNDDIISDIKYYNVLRNFNYHFDIIDVHDKGYDTIREAMAGAAGNNLSGSSAASKLDNISDHVGRIWVSNTDTTLVTGDAISLKYKYIQNAFDPSSAGYNVVTNDAVTLDNMLGDVIYAYEVAESDITTGKWAGYRNITLYINEPQTLSVNQAIRIKTNSANLNRQVRFNLKKRFKMEVECTPKVRPEFGTPVDVNIKLPASLTDDMFPLELQIEVRDKSLSPDVSNSEFQLPVKTAASIIPSLNSERSFHYVLTIPDVATFDALESEGNMKIVPTDWLTNLQDNASTVYVDNKYFELAFDSWENYIYEFTNPSLSLTNVPYGIGREVSVSYTLDGDDANRLSRVVTLILNGLTHTGAEVDEDGNTILTVSANGGDQYVTLDGNTVTVSGLKTTTEDGSIVVYIDASEYLNESLDANRTGNEFTDLSFNPSTLAVGPNIPVTFSFNMPAYYDDMVVYVEMDGLVPADNETRLVEVEGRSTIKTYAYSPTAEGTQTLYLKTINNEPCTCMISLDTPDEYYYAPASHSVLQTPVSYHFNARFDDGTPEFITSSSEVKVVFDINENDGYTAGMIVNVTLDKFVPKDNNQGLQAIADNVYRYIVSEPGQQEFILKPANMEAGTCSVTLEATDYYFVTETRSVEQSAATFAMMVRNNSDQGNYYDAQVIYGLPEALANGNYILEFVVKADQNLNDLSNFVFIKEDLANGGQIMCKPNRNNITTTWQKMTVSFTVSSGHYDYVAFNIGKIKSGTYIYFDNISLKRENSNNELINNWNFETGNTNGWFKKCNSPYNCEIFITSPGYIE